MSVRRKRRVATKATIIEISDSEDDESTPAKRALTSSNGIVDRAARSAAGNKERQRWPDKEKRSATASNLTEPENVENEVLLVEETDGQSFSRSEAAAVAPVTNLSLNESLPTRTNRNSFWERRKVWNIHELLAETQNIDTGTAQNIVRLFENENTIPFICRYRRDLISHITPERMRDIKNSYTEIVDLRKKAETIVKQLEKENVVDAEVRTEMLCAKTTEELEFLYAPYKQASKGSLAQRAKALGLEVYADQILNGDTPPVRLEHIVDRNIPELDSVEKVITGICHIISHNISKHTGVLEELMRLRKVQRIFLKSTKTKPTKTTTKEKPKPLTRPGDESKYELYFDFQADVRQLKPHQVLAINRAEKSKFLTVKIQIDDYFKRDIKHYIFSLFLSHGQRYELRNIIFERTFEECYTKKLQPLLSRQIRADLNDAAKKASIDVFAKNLKQLLLMSPLKGERILGIDPGFANGCKLAMISETADVLETGVIYPHTRNADPELVGEKLAKLLVKHNCKIIALGNGTACRETEFWLTKLFQVGILDERTVRYSIVSEQGASIYSCNEVARKEFPDMDTNEISAVSIARRLNDPLSEYVKIEPRHIGVGMYQHDINEKTLNESLNEVVSECVSFVGVDINTASLSVLKHIAGLTEKKAEKIIAYRAENGAFRSRKDLLAVKSVGEKTYIQCAGFIRIEPLSVGGKVANLLDCTWVHPESYDVAKKIISKCDLKLKDIGKPAFVATIKAYAARTNSAQLAAEFKIPKERLEIVFVALQRELFQDYRADFDKRPLFKQGVTRLNELKVGDVVTGAVTNITHFGAFVDIGVECDGLIHTSKMNRCTMNIGDRVTASIVQVDVKRRRIGLRLEEMLVMTET